MKKYYEYCSLYQVFIPTYAGGHYTFCFCSKTIDPLNTPFDVNKFNKKIDFRKYPRNIKKDIMSLKKLNVNYLFIPKIKDIYKFNSRKFVLRKKDKILCAKFRRGHFEGVLDVMERLTNLVKPKKIFMGKKDYQQYFLIKNYLKNKYKTSIIPCKTIRNKDKIALSSRNNHLDFNGAQKASFLSKNLIKLKGMTQGMLVILGQKNIKKLKDFADLSSDELIGGFDEIKGKKIRIEGYLEEFSLSRKEADELIMSAREIAYK